MSSVLNTVINEDVIKGLKLIPDNSVELVITSPPYNLSINYDGYDDNLAHADYLAWMKSVWIECYMVLVDGGRICINVALTTNKEEEILEKIHPLHVDFTN